MVGSNFFVDWAGNLNCTGMNAINANLSGTLNVGNELKVEGTLSGGTIDGATIIGGTLSVGPSVGENGYQLYADSTGVTIESATIKNCTIENSSIQNGDGSSANFSIPANGIGGLVTQGVFDNCYVSGNLYVGTPASEESGAATGNIVLQGNNIYFGSDASKGYIRYEDGKVVIMNYGLYVSEVITFVNYCNGIYCLGDCKNYSGGNTFLSLMSDTIVYTGKDFTIQEGAKLKVGKDDLEIDGQSLDVIIKGIIRDSVSITVDAYGNDTEVTGGTNGIYTVKTTDEMTVSAKQDIYCYFTTNPDGGTGYHKSLESYSPPSDSYLWTKCTDAKSEKQKINTYGSIKATITIKD